ncbi:MAG: hypothetical protein MZV63_08225 [Marinilabiliales bacterium]|nr:hypothetical protein [Marinilabiliales bacterium]
MQSLLSTHRWYSRSTIALQEKNIRIPQDVALVSMEDGIGFDLLTTPVTRLRRPLVCHVAQGGQHCMV